MAKKIAQEVQSKPVRKRAALAVRWEDIPHTELWAQALAGMSPGSIQRSAADAVRSVLRRRLARLEPADHTRYIELECVRIVETLRAVRDAYRAYLQPRVRGPIAEMYWVVMRFGVKDWAIMLLRSTAITYIGACHLKSKDWKALFGFEGPFNDLVQVKTEGSTQGAILTDIELSKSITALLRQEAMDEFLTGGPFGLDSQVRFARTFPGKAFLLQQETFNDAIERRLAAWQASVPWTEGLACLFDAAQEEVAFQYEQLSIDGRSAELALATISPLQRIAHRHLIVDGQKDASIAASASEKWNLLLGHLDKAGIVLDQELKGKPRETLMALRKKGKAISNWSDCYSVTTAVTLEDGRTHNLRREITRFLQNAAQQAGYQLAKVWSPPRTQGSPAKRRRGKQQRRGMV